MSTMTARLTVTSADLPRIRRAVTEIAYYAHRAYAIIPRRLLSMIDELVELTVALDPAQPHEPSTSRSVAVT